jgi:hypothetical protein
MDKITVLCKTYSLIKIIAAVNVDMGKTCSKEIKIALSLGKCHG